MRFKRSEAHSYDDDLDRIKQVKLLTDIMELCPRHCTANDSLKSKHLRAGEMAQ